MTRQSSGIRTRRNAQESEQEKRTRNRTRKSRAGFGSSAARLKEKDFLA
jgi:hypothetical protein